MSFHFAFLNPQVLDDLKVIYAKPAQKWTAQETLKARMAFEAMRIVISYAPIEPANISSPQEQGRLPHVRNDE